MELNGRAIRVADIVHLHRAHGDGSLKTRIAERKSSSLRLWAGYKHTFS